MKNNQPNVVVVLADDFGYGDAGCYGAIKIPTPNIDKLAKDGLRFTDAHSSNSVCTPSRYSLLTGRYAWRGRLKSDIVSGWEDCLLEKDRLNLGKLFHQYGYNTACVGKWHLGWTWATKDEKKVADDGANVDYIKPLIDGPNNHGFDYFFGFPGPLDFPPYCFVENDRVVEEPTDTIDKERSRIPAHLREQRDGVMSPSWKNEDLGSILTQKACEWIENQKDNNFFLYFPLSAPHVPCTPPDFIKGKSQAGARGDMCVEVDWSVGEIVKTLEKNGLADNTIIIFASDNGALLGDPILPEDELPNEEYGNPENYKTFGHKSNGDYRGRKHLIYDGGHRVPLVIRWDNHIKPNDITDALFSYTDFMATFSSLLGYELKSDEGEDSMDALSLLLQDGECIYNRDHVIHQGMSGLLSLRKDDWKLINGGGQGFCDDTDFDNTMNEYQLFNITDDMGEEHDLSAESHDKVNELKETLINYVDAGCSAKR